MSDLVVQFRPTPNPNAGKFETNRQVVASGSRSYASVADTEADSVARALFGLDGVEAVFMVKDFITVTKAPDAQWDALAPQVERTIREHL